MPFALVAVLGCQKVPDGGEESAGGGGKVEDVMEGTGVGCYRCGVDRFGRW